MKRLITALLCIALILSLAACGGGKEPEPQPTETKSQSYRDVFAVVKELQKDIDYSGVTVWNRAFSKDAAVDDMAVPEAADGASASPEFSGTNVQVEGIDEGDIVKTDGEYIYSLYNNTLKIYKADGENTALVSTTEITSDENMWLTEMYVNGTQLIFIGSEYGIYDYGIIRSEYEPPKTKILVYDVSDASKPSYVNCYGQDGDLVSSRLLDGTLYLVTDYNLWEEAKEDEPETFVPRTYCNDKAELIPADCICIMPAASSTSYTVATKLSLADGAQQSVSVLGGSSMVYMSYTALYTAATEYTEETSEAYTDGIYKVTDYTTTDKTKILKIDLESMTAAGSVTVKGYLESQFSMDEYNGKLRIVTTSNPYSWSEYVDEENDFINTKWDDTAKSSTGLYILDSSLNQLAAIEGLAEGEYVRSVRFDGDFVYFCTFRQTDPLFAVDVSDANNPQILSEYKISGFSEYLHAWSDGLLFGLGLEADEETGATDGMKLVMFDVSDKADVKAKHTLKLDSYYSEALYDHHALLISSEKGIIGFPTDSGYDFYGYSEDTGFTKLSNVSLEDGFCYSSRGLYIGDFVYVVSDVGTAVLDMQSFSLVKTAA